MYLAAVADNRSASLAEVRDTLARIASRLDARFVEAGSALARGYEIVEQLVASLEGVTNAMDSAAADAAIGDMRAVADRLERLPAIQDQRRAAIATIGEVGGTLRSQLLQLGRVLSFLRICGLNMKVAAAGAAGFAGFADTMFERLDFSEEQMGGATREIEALVAGIGAMAASEARLAAECVKVIPEVPRRLVQNAVTLQAHQAETAGMAARVADAARGIRTRVATALGALQIGDITRQRLEHIVQGMALLDDRLRDGTELDAEQAREVETHVLALLAGQAADTLDGFARESRMLGGTLRDMGPEASGLLALNRTAPEPDSESGSFLDRLEQNIAEVHRVTGRLQEADVQSDRVSGSTSAAAESLGRRLEMVRRVKNDVHQMAWNTDLRCYRMGNEGLALGMVASEIRGFANRLEDLTGAMAATFQQLAGAANSMRGRSEGEARVEAGEALSAALDCVRQGGQRMRQGLAGLDGNATAVAEILRRATEDIDCEADVAIVSEASAQLAAHATHAGAPPAAATEILDEIARSYTMAREREIHREFTGSQPDAAESGAETAEDEDDDGLF